MSSQVKRSVLSEASQAALILDTARAMETFEVYYALGPERTLLTLEKHMGIPFDVLKQWAAVHAWEEKIRERTKELDRAYEAYYKDKTRDIRNNLISQMENLIGEMNASSLGLPFHIKDVSDFRALAQAYESLVRANTMAQRAVEATKEEAPQTWSDLLTAMEHQGGKVLDHDGH